MEFRNIVIARPARLFLRNHQLVISQEEDIPIPMEDICTLMIESQQVLISAAAMEALASAGVTVFFCDEKHLPSAQLFSFHQHSRKKKLLFAQFELPKPLKKRLWQSVVQAKIKNQAACLRLLGLYGSEDLEQLAGNVHSGDTGNMEAAAASAYFRFLYGDGFTRGLDCLENSAMNYGYAIIRGNIARNLVVHGLDPAVGIFHHSEQNAFNLADDILEPYRPLVDLYVASMHFGDAEELLPAHKRQLFNLTNYLVLQDHQKLRVMISTDRTTASLAASILEQEHRLALPQLIALEEGRYE